MLEKIIAIPAVLKCIECNALTSSDSHCEFCGKQLPERNWMIRKLVRPWKYLLTVFVLTFAPWTAAKYIETRDKGHLIGPLEFLASMAGIWWLAHVRVAGIFGFIPIFGEPHWAKKWVLYGLLLLIMGATSLASLVFLKAFGSSSGVANSWSGICYWLGLGALLVAAQLLWHIGPLYRLEKTGGIWLTPSPAWELAICFVLMTWASVILSVIEGRVHGVQWYKALASFWLGAVVFFGWTALDIDWILNP